MRFLIIPILLAVYGALSFSDLKPDTPEQLGEQLFFDPILSLDSTVSCASCHIPQFAFGDTLSFSKGVGGRIGKRNAPAITNMAFRAHFFFDGRAATLEQQVLIPIMDTVEMRSTPELVTKRLRNHGQYANTFRTLYNREADMEAVSHTLAAFVRTLETADSDFDRYMAGDANAMSADAVRGREIFMKKGKCFDCHFSPDFTGDEFRNIGLFNGKELNDPGRFNVTKDSADIGKFKVPGLRNVAVTAPFMHNGMYNTMEEVIEYYDTPNKFIPDAIGRDSLLQKPLGLTKTEKSDLKAFLEALTDDRFKKS